LNESADDECCQIDLKLKQSPKEKCVSIAINAFYHFSIRMCNFFHRVPVVAGQNIIGTSYDRNQYQTLFNPGLYT
jgi:hypothetical protein